MQALLLAVLLAAAHHKADLRTQGLGHSCQKNSGCKSKAQRCLHEMDANGKETDHGFCVLPCAALDAGTTKVVPGHPVDPASIDLRKKAPPRCPAKFLCRSAGSGVPIDMCVKE